MALGSPSIPEQLSQITNQLLLLSQSLEEIKQRWEQENGEVDTLRIELSQAKELNKTFQTRIENLEAQPERRKSNMARQTLGRYLREDIARTDARLTHARDNDLISNRDVYDNVQSEQGSRDTSLQTERERDYNSQPRIVATDSEEEEKPEEKPDGYLSSSSQTKHDVSFPGASNNHARQITSGNNNAGSPTSSTKHFRIYHESASVTSASATLPPEFAPESYPVHPNAPQWTIQIQKPPASAKVTCGPMKWSHLFKKLSMDRDTAVSLKSLSSNDTLKLGLRIQGDYAFVYDPIFLEDKTTPATYLFDWGIAEDNQNITRYIQGNSEREQQDSIFHTFVYILKPRRWHYVGSQKWIETSLDLDIWKTFGEQDHIRSRVIQRLYDHCGNKIERETIVEMLDSGVLKQLCIHLSGDGHIDSSRAMCSAMDYSPPTNRAAHSN